MWKHLLSALACLWGALWRRIGKLKGPFDHTVADGERSERALRLEVRARFWAAVREGQREAEANSRRNP
jgi:hypothetical protein